MARKPKHEEHENHERWLVSYADFITLLFAFFVVMYAISSLNEGKYRVLSSSLVTAFSHPSKTLDPIQYGTPLRAPIIQHQSMIQDDDAVSRVGVDHQIMPSPKELAEMQKIADEVTHQLKDLIEKDIVNVKKTNQGVEIEIKSKILFSSGQARLSLQAVPVLKKIAAILAKIPSEVNVEGYTDNVPIKTFTFPSNWELSAARAASVVRLFTETNIDPQRLKAIGFGEYQPIASNATAKGRSKNRRVTIVVLNKPSEKRQEILGKNKGEDQEAEKKPSVVSLPPPTENKPQLLLQNSNKPKITNLRQLNTKPANEPISLQKEQSDKPKTIGGNPTADNRATPATTPIRLPGPTLIPLGKKE